MDNFGTDFRNNLSDRFKREGNTAPSMNTAPSGTVTEGSLLNLHRQIKDSFTPESRGITPGFEISDYSKHLGDIFDPRADIDEQRARSQSIGGLAVRGFGQLATEATLGTLEALGYAFDFEELFNSEKQAEEGFTNWFSDAIRKAKESVQENVFPVYMTEEAMSGSLGERLTDASFWASHGKTIGTSLSLMLPSLTAGALIGSGVGAVGGSAMLASLAGGAGAAMLSRKAESAMEAYGSFEENYNRFLSEGLDDATARSRAGKVAADVVKANAAMLPVDMLQYMTLLKPFKALGAAKTAMLSTKTGKALGAGFNIGSEAMEEAYQFVAAEEALSKEVEGTEMFGQDFGKRLGDYVKDTEFQVSAILGGAMGGLFDFVGGPVYNKGIVPARDRALAEIDKSTAKKMRAAFLQDKEAFDSADQQLTNKIIAKNLVAGRLDKLGEDLDLFAQTIKEQEGITPEEIKEVETKVSKIKAEAIKVQEEDRKLMVSDKYRTNRSLRNEYLLNQLEFNQIGEEIAKTKAEYLRMEALNTDPKDKAVQLEKEIEGFSSQIREVGRNRNLTDELKEAEIESLSKKIEHKRDSLKSLIETIKQEDPLYRPEEYSNTRAVDMARLQMKGLALSLKRDRVLAPYLKEVQNLTKEQADKANQDIENKVKENTAKDKKDGTKTVVSSAKTVDDLVDTAEKVEGAGDIIKEEGKKGVVSNVIETKGKEGDVKLGEEKVFTPQNATVAHDVQYKDVVQDTEGNTYEVVGVNKNATTKKITTITVKDSSGNTHYFKPDEVAKIGKLESRPVQTTTESGLTDISKIYSKDGVNVDAGKETSFVAHIEKLHTDMKKLFGDDVRPQIQELLNSLDLKRLKGVNKLQTVNKALTELQKDSEIGVGVKNYLRSFVTDMAEFMDTVTVLPKSGDISPEDIASTESLEEQLLADLRNEIDMFDIVGENWFYEFYKGEVKRDENGNPIAASPRIQHPDYSPNLVIDKNVGNAGSEVHFQIDLDLPFNKKLIAEYNANPTPEGLTHLIDKINVYISQDIGGKRIPISILRSPQASRGEDNVKNRELRQAIYKTIEGKLGESGILDSDISTKVVKKFGDTINNNRIYLTPDKIYELLPEQFKPTFRKDGSGKLLPILGVVRQQNGVNYLHIPNLPEMSKSSVPKINLPLGSVAMIVLDSSGNIVPVYTPTKKFRELSEDVYNNLLSKIETLVEEAFAAKTNKEAKDKLRELQNIVYIPIRRSNKGNKLTLTLTKNKSYRVKTHYNNLITKDKYSHTEAMSELTASYEGDYTPEELASIIEGNKNIEKVQVVIASKEDVKSPEFLEILRELRVQIDKEKLNTEERVGIRRVDFNEQLFKEGRIVSNINPEMPFHSPMFSLSSEYTGKAPAISEPAQEVGDIVPPEIEFPSEAETEIVPPADDFEQGPPEVWEVPDMEGVPILGLEDVEFVREKGIPEEVTTEKINTEETQPIEEDVKKVEEEVLGGTNITDEAEDAFGDPLLSEVSGEVTEVINIDKELDWLYNVLPVGTEEDQVRIEVADTVLMVGDKKAWGYFTDNLIKIFNGAPAGTVYHEAFHAVFHLGLNEAQRNNILKEAQRKYGVSDSVVLEEELAKEFTKYIQNNAKQTKGLGERILAFFKNLWYMITNRLDRNYDIQSLFDRINSGQFKNLKYAKSPEVRLSEASMERLTDLQKENRINNVVNFMTLAYRRRASNPKYVSASRIDILNSFGSDTHTPIEGIMKEAITMLQKHKNAINSTYKTKGLAMSPAMEFQINFMLTQTFALENKAIPEGKLNLKQLGKEAIKQFAYIENISLRLDTGEEINGLDQETDQSIYELEDEINKVEHWQIESMQISRKDGAPAEVRRELSYIRLKESDDIGFPRYISFSQAFGTLIRELSDSKDAIEMLDRIENLSRFRPEYRPLYDKLKEDRSLLTIFHTGLQNSHADFKTLLEHSPDGQTNIFTWSSSNRNRIDNVLSTAWRTGLYDTGFANKQLAIEMDKLRDLEGDALDAARVAFSKLPIIEVMRTNYGSIKPSNMINSDSYVKAAQIFNSFGIDIRAEELEAMKETYSTFYSNMSHVVNSIMRGIDPYASGSTELTAAIKVYKTFKDDLFESSFQNLERKTQYAHILRGFLVKQMTSLKTDPKVLESYLSDPLYTNLDWLYQLKNNKDFKDNFDYAIVSGFRGADNSATPYNKMTPQQLDTIRLNAFFNNSKEGWAYYMVPTLADSPTGMFIQSRRLREEDALVSVIEVLKGERDRVDRSRKNPELIEGIKFYEQQATEYVMFPELAHLHDLLGDTDTNYEAIRVEVKKYMDNIVEVETNRLKDSGIVTLGKNNKLKSEFIDPRAFVKKSNEAISTDKVKFESVEEYIRSYVYNSVPSTAQMILLFSGDPAMYKNIVDFFKRQKQVWTPTTRLDVGAEFNLPTDLQEFHGGATKRILGGVYSGVYMEDIEMPTTIAKEIINVFTKAGYGAEAYNIASKFGFFNGYVVSSVNKEGKSVQSFFENKGDALKFAKNDSKKIKKASRDPETGAIFDKVKDISLTDGQSFIHPRRYSDVQIGLGRWNATREREFQKMMRLENSNDEYQHFKPFSYGFRDYRGIKVPYQHKNSEYTLRPDVAYITKEGKLEFPDASLPMEERYNKYVAPTLARIYNVMDSRGIDSFHFNTAVKVGDIHSAPIDKMEEAEIHFFDNSDYGLIQETPSHYVDDLGNFGVQLRKLIISDLPISEYTVGGKVHTREEISKLWQDIISEDLAQSFKEVSDEFSYDESAYSAGDYTSYNESLKRVQNLIINNLRSKSKGTELEKAFTLKTDENGKKRFALPLHDPIHAKEIEALLGAIFKNNVIKQQVPGGSLVQVSSIGYNENLKVKFKENGELDYYEAALPFWTKEHLKGAVNDNGEIDFDKIQDKDILRLIGYRIPTEGKYSMIPMRVKYFLPQKAGASIMLPLEITAITGADFDIDKMYIMVPSMKTISRWKHKEVRNYLRDAGFTVDMNSKFVNTLFDKINNRETLNDRELEVWDYLKGLPESQRDSLKEFAVQQVKYDINSSVSEQSRAPRDNMKFDIVWNILTNPKINDQLLFPGENSPLNEVADEITRRLGITDNLPLLHPGTITNVFERNMMGAGLIGIFANHNVNHAITQHGNLKLSSPFIYDGDSFNSLSEEYVHKQDNLRISNNLAMFLRAILDNAKDPISSKINLNGFSSDVYALMLRMGVPLKDTIFFMNQPVVLELYKRFNKTKGTASDYNRVLKSLSGEFSSPKEIELNLNKLDSSLGKNIEDSDQDFIDVQTAVLKEFDNLYGNAKVLGRIVRVFRTDDTKRKITSAANEAFKMDYAKTMDLEGGSVNGLNDLLDKYSMMESFMNYGIFESGKILQRFFPYDTAVFNTIKTSISENLGGYKTLNAEHIEMINLALLNYMATKFEFFNPNNRLIDNKTGQPTDKTELQYFLEDFTKDFLSFKRLVPEVNNYAIMNYLQHVPKGEGVAFDRIMFKKAGTMSGNDVDRIKRSWKMMLNNPNKRIRDFASSLIKYTIYSHGFGIEAGTFTQFIPEDWRAFLKESKVNGQSYIDFLDNMLQSTNMMSNITEFMGFERQFFQHEFFNTFFVERVAHKDANEKIKNKSLIIKNGEPVSMSINSDEDIFYIKDKAKRLKNGKITPAAFYRYISVELNNKVYLMEAINLNDKRNSDIHLGGLNYQANYRVIPAKGRKGVVKEYNFYNDGLTPSLIPSNNPKNFVGNPSNVVFPKSIQQTSALETTEKTSTFVKPDNILEEEWNRATDAQKQNLMDC